MAGFLFLRPGPGHSNTQQLRPRTARVGTDLFQEAMTQRAFTLTVVPPRQATVAWTAPTTNSAGQSFDGTSNDRKIAKYRVYYGTDATAVQNKTSSYWLPENTGTLSPYAAPPTSVTITGLTAGTWYFRVTAFDGDTPPDESDVSSPGSKVIA